MPFSRHGSKRLRTNRPLDRSGAGHCRGLIGEGTLSFKVPPDFLFAFRMQDAPAPQDPRVGTIVAGRYRLVRVLGEGGMGRVYLAEHVAIQKQVALKVLRAEYATKRDLVSRFQQEAISASRIKHPNVLDVFDFGRLEDGSFYLAMEFLEGHDLAQEIQGRTVLDPASVVRIAIEISRALGAAHNKGVIHRDLKPENVFLQRTDDGGQTVKIVDFGIALLRGSEAPETATRPRRLTKTGVIFGTPEYMAPEQAAGKHPDHRADVYALGVMLYEMFTGSVPFVGETFLGVLAKQLNDAPRPMKSANPELRVSPELQGVVLRALEKNPEERYQSMAELGRALLTTPEGDTFARSGRKTESAPRLETEASTPGSSPESPAPDAWRRAPTVAGSARTLAGDGARTGDPRVVPRALSKTGSTEAWTLAAPALGLLLLVSVLIGGFLWLRRSAPAPEGIDGDRVSELPKAAVSPRPSSTEALLDASAEAPAPSAGVQPAPVRLSVVTDPPGATVSKDGFQVCDQTPCEVFAGLNETLELQAAKGSLRGERKVLAQGDQKVSIQLAGPRVRTARRPTISKPRLCEVEVEGLKILRPCD